jgi:DNA-binding NtrC family response regulator
MLRAYAWPGNVRELRNVIESLLLTAEGETVTGDEVAALFEAAPQVSDCAADPRLPASALGPAASLEEAERAMIMQAIGRSHANLAEAARSLGISRSTLYRKMERYGLTA